MGREIINVVEGKEQELCKPSSARELPLLALNHVSFVCESVKKSVEFYQQVLGFVLIKRSSSFDFEGAWIFFHDPDGYMVEICNCQNIPILPISSCPIKINKMPNPNPPFSNGKGVCRDEVEAQMIENLASDMMEFSI
ncbi:glyoxylase I 4-like [Primulina huaijiensis]|uniref:glyoxylase I 4-like n=1 Tax=Primulina huaijiensis TaxID=1492673 RepID=UPI003CC71F9D